MTDDSAETETTPVAPKVKLAVLVSRNGQFIVRPIVDAPENIVMPLNLQGDPRLFVKNGEIVRPFVKGQFAYVQTLDVAGMEIAIYGETSLSDFDPSDMEPITVRSLDKDFEELNQAR